jgi:hypothetical protein
MAKAKAEKAAAEAPQVETRRIDSCDICGATVNDIDTHMAWHESQQEKYVTLAEFHDVPVPTPQGEAVLTAPPVDTPEVVPQAVTWTAADPDVAPDSELAIIHVPK